MRAAAAGECSEDELAPLYESALRDTIEQLEATGSQLITDGEQTKPSFATYPLTGLENLAPDGVEIPFGDGHVRQLPRLTGGPFRYGVHADAYLEQALAIAGVPLKQAVIAPSALSLLYPQQPIDGYPREVFLARPGQRIFIGVIDPIDPRVETPEEVCERVLEAAEYIEPDRLGTTDDCGFAPFGDDTSTPREVAFAKIRARVEGTALASRALGV